jgi:hypothetical protein
MLVLLKEKVLGKQESPSRVCSICHAILAIQHNFDL